MKGAEFADLLRLVSNHEIDEGAAQGGVPVQHAGVVLGRKRTRIEGYHETKPAQHEDIAVPLTTGYRCHDRHGHRVHFVDTGAVLVLLDHHLKCRQIDQPSMSPQGLALEVHIRSEADVRDLKQLANRTPPE